MESGCCGTTATCGCSETGKCSCPAGKCNCGAGCACGSSCSNKSNVLGIRKPAPYFEAAAWYNGFKTVKLTDFKGKYLVLFFYPLDFTFVCPTEICQFSDRA